MAFWLTHLARILAQYTENERSYLLDVCEGDKVWSVAR